MKPLAPYLMRYVTRTSKFILFLRLFFSILMSFSLFLVKLTMSSKHSISNDFAANSDISLIGIMVSLLPMMLLISLSDYVSSLITVCFIYLTFDAAFLTNHIVL
jgi:hypothetical protein